MRARSGDPGALSAREVRRACGTAAVTPAARPPGGLFLVNGVFGGGLIRFLVLRCDRSVPQLTRAPVCEPVPRQHDRDGASAGR